MTYDQLAVHAILHGNTAQLKRLNAKAKQAIGTLCPECGTDGSHIEDNGQQGRGLAFLCLACEHQWDSVDITV